MKTIGKYFYSGVLILVSIAVLGVPIVESYAAEPIRVRIFIEKGSVWDSPKGRELIKQEIKEAYRIWVGKAQVKLKYEPKIDFTPLKASARSLVTEDVQRYAVTHKAKARDIVAVFTDSPSPRGYADDSLVKANTPVILIGREVYDKPGTKRDLAHELGHVILRDPGHVYYDVKGWDPSEWTYGDNIMNQKVDCGDRLNSEQKKTARKYPYPVDLRLSQFVIVNVSHPSRITSGGAPGDLVVSCEGNPKFPVTMIYRPKPGWGCPQGGCQTVRFIFHKRESALTFKGALWCRGYKKSNFFDYEVLLIDAEGRETPAMSAGFNCIVK